MAFVVETGAGVPSANALATVAQVTERLTDQGQATAWVAASQADQEAAIVRATAYLETFAWEGYPTNQRAQTVPFPRSNLRDDNGYYISVDEIPREVIWAIAELASREQANPGALTPDFVASDQVTSERIGQIAVTYGKAAKSARDLTPQVKLVNAYLSQFMRSGSGTPYAGSATR